jgi:hypothetical protein
MVSGVLEVMLITTVCHGRENFMKKYLLIAILLSIGCGGSIDLTQPACLVIPEDEDLNTMAYTVGLAWLQWTKDFPQIPDPQIVRHRDDCGYNIPIEFHLKYFSKIAGLCTWTTWGFRIEIDPEWLYDNNVMAHEIGHVLLNTPYHVRGDTNSIMQLDSRTSVQMVDIMMLCNEHPEIECKEIK